MSLPDRVQRDPGPRDLIEYQLVRMNGSVIVMFISTLDQALLWLPDPGSAPQGPVAGRYRILPDGPWIVRAYYPDGYPGPQAPWPEDPGLPGSPLAIGLRPVSRGRGRGMTVMSGSKGGSAGKPGASGLVDVIDTILDKGLVLDAYVRVSLVGIEVIAVDARVVISSVDTYLRFADAMDRLGQENLGHPEPKGLGDTLGGVAGGLTEGVTRGGAKGKSQGAVEGAGKGIRNAIKGFVDDDEDRAPARRRR